MARPIENVSSVFSGKSYFDIQTFIMNTFFRALSKPSVSEEQRKIILGNLTKATDVNDEFIFRSIVVPEIILKKEELSKMGLTSVGDSEDQKKYFIKDGSFLRELCDKLTVFLSLIEKSKNINPGLLDDPKFIQAFFNSLNYLLMPYKMSIANFSSFLPGIVKLINDCLGREFIVIDCRDGITSYECGRAMEFKTDPGLVTRIIIYNSLSEYDSNPDYLHIQAVRDKYHGGNYYEKYLKYKTKYLQLKNRL